MRPTLREVFQQLSTEGLIAAEDENRFREVLRQRVQQDTPWYLKLLMGVGAWVATGLFLLFLAVADVFRHESVLVILGLLMVGAGVVLRLRTEVAMLGQVALSLSFVGQVMTVFGVGAMGGEETGASAVALVLSLVLIVLFRDPIHRFVSTVSAMVALAFLLIELSAELAPSIAYVLLVAATVAFWQRKPALIGLEAQLQAPVGHGLAVSLLVMAVPFSLEWGDDGWRRIVASLALTLGVLFVVARTFGIPQRRPDVLAYGTLGVTLLVGVATLQVPGIQAALVLMVIAMNRRDPLLLGEAAVAFAYFLSWYYYSLELTLLHKSAALIVSGGLLLGAWRLLHHARVLDRVRS